MRRQVKFYAPRGFGVYDFRVIDLASMELLGRSQSIRVDVSALASCTVLLGGGCSGGGGGVGGGISRARVQVQGKDLPEALRFALKQLDAGLAADGEEGGGDAAAAERRMVTRVSASVASLRTLLARAADVDGGREMRDATGAVVGTVWAAAVAVSDALDAADVAAHEAGSGGLNRGGGGGGMRAADGVGLPGEARERLGSDVSGGGDGDGDGDGGGGGEDKAGGDEDARDGEMERRKWRARERVSLNSNIRCERRRGGGAVPVTACPPPPRTLARTQGSAR